MTCSPFSFERVGRSSVRNLRDGSEDFIGLCVPFWRGDDSWAKVVKFTAEFSFRDIVLPIEREVLSDSGYAVPAFAVNPMYDTEDITGLDAFPGG